jgi:hypothetical protein
MTTPWLTSPLTGLDKRASNSGRMVNINVLPNMDCRGKVCHIVRVVDGLAIDHRMHVVPTLNMHLIARTRMVRSGRKRINETHHPVPRLAAAKKQVQRARCFMRWCWTRTGVFAGEQIAESGQA